MQFEVDSRIHTSSFWLGDWPLSSVYLKNDANFPWLILVPREENVQEIYQLSIANRHMLMNEIAELSKKVDEFFKPDKLNIGTLGNVVSQLHVHVVARFKIDKLWPHGIWQPTLTPVLYTAEEIAALTPGLSKKIANSPGVC